jgi:hypothetical protein
MLEGRACPTTEVLPICPHTGYRVATEQQVCKTVCTIKPACCCSGRGGAHELPGTRGVRTVAPRAGQESARVGALLRPRRRVGRGRRANPSLAGGLLLFWLSCASRRLSAAFSVSTPARRPPALPVRLRGGPCVPGPSCLHSICRHNPLLSSYACTMATSSFFGQEAPACRHGEE